MRKVVAGLFMSLDGVQESPEKWTGPYTFSNGVLLVTYAAAA